ncbi:hypothetical protein Btru_077161 [Bulinus truncatus]|nr:hypothetical protein Btru_077161 [Bulinus truncatus]
MCRITEDRNKVDKENWKTWLLSITGYRRNMDQLGLTVSNDLPRDKCVRMKKTPELCQLELHFMMSSCVCVAAVCIISNCLPSSDPQQNRQYKYEGTKQIAISSSLYKGDTFKVGVCPPLYDGLQMSAHRV